MTKEQSISQIIGEYVNATNSLAMAELRHRLVTYLRSDDEQHHEIDGAALIAEERQRQVSEKGWTAEHVDAYDKGELTDQAVALAVRQAWTDISRDEAFDIWGLAHAHQNDRVRQLVIAGALIAAEIDRIRRAKA